jgi:aminoglycoside phosphotransferase (APT) family kinase protein
VQADVTLATWMRELTGDAGPFSIRQLSGGNSNETLLVSSPATKRILRRAPAAALDASAHNVERERRMMAALANTGIPVPRPFGVSTAEGKPTLLMEFIDGCSITTELPDTYPDGSTAVVANAVIDALADVHSLPWRELGLADFGRPEDFLARQVGRWRKQYAAHQHRELPDFDIVAAWLEQNRPPDAEPGILHGDFHVDNCLFSRDAPARLLAIIDWEMSTIGDPLLDLGLLLALWGDDRPSPCAMPRVQGFSRSGDAPSREMLAERYANRSGRSTEYIHYYMALALWKLAAIVEGAHLHYTAGRLQTQYAQDLDQDVPRLLAEARIFTGV